VARAQPIVLQLKQRVDELEEELAEAESSFRQASELCELIKQQSIDQLKILSWCYSAALILALAIAVAVRWNR